MPEQEYFTAELVGDVTVLSIKRSAMLDEQLIQQMGAAMFALVDDDGVRKLVIDFTKVTNVAAAFLGKLLTLHRKLWAHGGKLVLCSLSSDLQQFLAAAKLDKLLVVSVDLLGALQALHL